MSLKLGTMTLTPYINSTKKITTQDIFLKEIEVSPKLTSKTYSAESYSVDGFSKITVLPVTADIDSNIKPENIKAGVSILGVLGTASASSSREFVKKIVDGTLTTITPEDLDGFTTIADYAFRGCEELTSVVLPDTIEYISHSSFSSNVDDLISNKYEDGYYLKSTSNDYFALYTHKYNGKINGIHPNTKIIVYVRSCPENLVIPDSVVSISKSAFSSNTDIVEINISNNIKNIENYTFMHCSNLKNIIFGSKIKTIGNSAFEDCESLESINIPDNIVDIKYSAFKDCTKLKTISLPSTLTFLDSYVFQNTPATSITFRGTMLQWSNQVNKGYSWKYGSSITSVICSDGTITL